MLCFHCEYITKQIRKGGNCMNRVIVKLERKSLLNRDFGKSIVEFDNNTATYTDNDEKDFLHPILINLYNTIIKKL